MARLLEHAQALEAERDAPFNPAAAGVLVPTAVTRSDKPMGSRTGRKRLTELHGLVTMRDVGGVATTRRLEEEAVATAAAEKKRLAHQKKEAAAAAAVADVAAFERCEHGCACSVVPCPYAKWKRCPACGLKSSLCKARACVAARKPLLLGYNPVVEGQQEALQLLE